MSTKGFFIFLFCALVSHGFLYGQVTIGSLDAAVPGALLQLKERETVDGSANANRGLNMPRVKLTNAHALYPMFETAPGSGTADSRYNTPALKLVEDEKHIGLMVYHIDQSVLNGVGLYVWNGTEWQKVGK